MQRLLWPAVQPGQVLLVQYASQPDKKRTNEKMHPVLQDAFFVVDDTGLEPVTLRTSSECSSQLS